MIILNESNIIIIIINNNTNAYILPISPRGSRRAYTSSDLPKNFGNCPVKIIRN